MILLVALACALVWTWVRGGRIRNLQHIPLRGLGFVLAAFALQAVLIYLPIPRENRELVNVPVLLVSFGLLAVFLWQNRELRGVKLLAAGFACNALVMVLNGGYMPVTYEALAAAGKAHLVTDASAGALVYGSKDILRPAAETALWFLSDIFVIPPPFPVSGVFSAGDVLIAIGIFRLVPWLFGAGKSVLPGTSEASHLL